MLRARIIIAWILLALPLLLQAATLENIRLWSENGRTRVVLDLSESSEHTIFTMRGPDRLVVDLKNARLGEALRKMPAGTGLIKGIRTGVRANGQLRVVLDLNQAVRSRSFTAGPNDQYGDRLVVDLYREGSPHPVKRASEEYVRGRDIVIVIDPGHGGRDPGAVGRGKTREKDVALAVSRKLAKRINREPGMRAILARNADIMVKHRQRMEIARRNKADLFISIHADAVDDRRAKGASVYALSLKGASDEAARRLAQRENAFSRVGDVTLGDKDVVLASVLLDLSQNAALGASLEAGASIIRELARMGPVHRRKVQQAGFLVLKSPDVPSILVEMAYISNPSEEKKLRNPAHQGRLADAIFAGIRNHFHANPPPATQLALNLRKNPSGQVRHVIASGDTLSEIAARYAVSMSAIRAANNMSGNQVRIGQTLRIPVFAGT
ncbi:MAG: N-acetylmuramoyl-L-alanine amidase [Proteobacteria bacterium]|nr:N-acetylmuramoyl-L-alanine amidase [Pseudomonadota bacterium]